jgi:hypothetical protein
MVGFDLTTNKIQGVTKPVDHSAMAFSNTEKKTPVKVDISLP